MISAYPPGFRECAVMLIRGGEISIRQLARALPVSETTLRRWAAPVVGEGGGCRQASASGVGAEAEVLRLRREVEALRRERDGMRVAVANLVREADRPI